MKDNGPSHLIQERAKHNVRSCLSAILDHNRKNICVMVIEVQELWKTIETIVRFALVLNIHIH